MEIKTSMMEKPPISEAIFSSTLSSLTSVLNRPNLYSAYLANSGVTSIMRKNFPFPITRIYSKVSTNKRTKNKVTLCKMIQTSSFYDVHTLNELAPMIQGIIFDDLVVVPAKVSGKARQPALPAVSPVKGDLLIGLVFTEIVFRN